MRRSWLTVLLLVIVTLPLTAQRGSWRVPQFRSTSLPYDGHFTFARLWYPYYGGWSYDWPEMEDNLSLIINEITAIPNNPAGGTILRMDDPELMKFPLAYLSEPGYWHPSEAEVMGLRTYLLKGGFLIIDDFHFEPEWAVFEAAMRRVLPAARIERLTVDHPVFNTFFQIKSLKVPYPGYLGESGLMGEFFGIYEDNDPKRRLMVVINYNMDVGDYIEHSGRAWYAEGPTHEAYKFGINYLIYGMTR